MYAHARRLQWSRRKRSKMNGKYGMETNKETKKGNGMVAEGKQ
jgi:hypothetical protein